MDEPESHVTCCGKDFGSRISRVKTQLERSWIRTKKLKSIVFDFDSLRRGAGVNVQDSNGYTPLHHACVRGHREIVRLLLAADASPCLVDRKGASPLHLAAWIGDSDVVRMLLAHNTPPANVDLLTSDHETALLYAAQFGHVDVVAMLLNYGADVTVRNNRDESALDLACQYGRLKIVRHLLSARPQLVDPYRAPGCRHMFPHTPLHRASRNGHRDVVAALLEYGVDPNVQTPNGTALHEAALCGKESVVSLLIQKGVKLNAKDRTGRTVAMLLSEYPEKATQKVREAILRSGATSSRYYESEDDLPAIPVQDQSPYENSSNCVRMRRSPSELDDRRRVSNASMKARETQNNTKTFDNDPTANSSSLTKIQPQSFVKKLASKCLGLKAKFNSAPNISNSGLESEVSSKSKSNGQTNNSNTLLIGNSKFFKILSKKEESGDMICNDEFDTISLDRLGTLERVSVVNRSNRSCPGFKVSLPNISENIELDDSRESLNDSIIIVELDERSEIEVKNDMAEAINEKTIFNIFEPRVPNKKEPENIKPNFEESLNTVNECYEPYEFSKLFIEQVSNSTNSRPKPQPRHNFKQSNNIDISVYENVVIDNHVVKPKPITRKVNSYPDKQTIYENLSQTIKEQIQPIVKPQPPKRIFFPVQSNTINNVKNYSVSSSNTSRSSTSSSDSLVDETNLEDVLLSKKSYSFKHTKKLESQTLSIKSNVQKSNSIVSNSSVVTEVSAIENIDCSQDFDKSSMYLSMTSTLPNKNSNNSDKPKILFRHKTFTTGEDNKDLTKIRGSLKWNNNFLRDTLKNYHIRGTGHCIYKGPTVEEFLHAFNRDNLCSSKTASFNKKTKRDSYFETAICFCKPIAPKYHNSAEDLLKVNLDDAKVTIDIDALLHVAEMSTTSFRCFCDDSRTCTFHTKKRESANALVIKFSAIKKSISTPDITLDYANDLSVRTKRLTKNKSFPKIENPYAVVDVTEIVARNALCKSNSLILNKYNRQTLLSITSSTSSTSERPYSVKDVAEVISLSDECSLTNDTGPKSNALCDNSMPRMSKSLTSSELPMIWRLDSYVSATDTINSESSSFKSCYDESDSDNETLQSDGDSSSDSGTLKSDVSATKRPWVDSDSFKFENEVSTLPRHVIEEESNSDESPSDSGDAKEVGVGVNEEVGDGSVLVALLERVRGDPGGVRSGSGRRRWDEFEATSEGDALSLSSAASSNAPHHIAHHYEMSKVSPTPPKKPPRRNLSVSPTHANSPSSAYSYELRPHARSQDDLDDIQSAKHYLKHGRSVDQYVDGKLSYVEYDENSPRAAPVPQPRPSLKHRVQPVAITTMCENVVMKEQNPRRKLRRNNFTHQYENFEPMRVIESRRKYSSESLLDDTPSDGENRIPSSPTHYDQPPTPDHPPPSARQAENSIHERIRPLSQLIMEVIEEIRIRKKSEADISEPR